MKKNKYIFNVQNILFLIVVCVVFCGCEKIKKKQKNISQYNTNSINLPKEIEKINPLFERSLQNDISMTSITNKIADFDTSIENKRVLYQLFNSVSAQKLTYAYVSNFVANISPVYVMKCTMDEYESCRSKTTPKEKAVMLLFEVIMNRDDAVDSARMMARYKLADYYMFHGDKFPERSEPWAEQLMKEAKLSDNANIYEKRTYASIQYDLMTHLVYTKSEEGIRQIRNIEKMANQGIPFGEQPLQIMPLFETGALVRLGRKAEARRLVQELYDKLDTIDDSIIHAELDKGVDAYFKQKDYN